MSDAHEKRIAALEKQHAPRERLYDMPTDRDKIDALLNTSKYVTTRVNDHERRIVSLENRVEALLLEADRVGLGQ